MRFSLCVLAALAVTTSPAFAQSDNQGENTDSLTIGIGAATTPRFEGSDKNHVVPGPQLRGSYGGISFTTQGTGLYTDVVPRRGQTGGKLVFGPVAHVTLNRSRLRSVRDAQIEALGKRDVGIELGAQIGYSQNGVITSDYDNLTIGVSAYHDVAGAHESYVVTPQISYGTPLSKTAYVGISAGAHYVGGKYAQTYFGVSPAGATASGLPVYAVGEGFKDLTFGGLAALSLTGDLRGGLSLFGGASYTSYLGKFRRSPITRDNGQWTGAIGLGYTF